MCSLSQHNQVHALQAGKTLCTLWSCITIHLGRCEIEWKPEFSTITGLPELFDNRSRPITLIGLYITSKSHAGLPRPLKIGTGNKYHQLWQPPLLDSQPQGEETWSTRWTQKPTWVLAPKISTNRSGEEHSAMSGNSAKIGDPDSINIRNLKLITSHASSTRSVRFGYMKGLKDKCNQHLFLQYSPMDKSITFFPTWSRLCAILSPLHSHLHSTNQLKEFQWISL